MGFDSTLEAASDIRQHPIMLRISAMPLAVFLLSPTPLPSTAAAVAATSIPVALSSFPHVTQTVRINEYNHFHLYTQYTSMKIGEGL